MIGAFLVHSDGTDYRTPDANHQNAVFGLLNRRIARTLAVRIPESECLSATNARDEQLKPQAQSND
jgi:hypothetical protein